MPGENENNYYPIEHESVFSKLKEALKRGLSALIHPFEKLEYRMLGGKELYRDVVKEEFARGEIAEAETKTNKRENQYIKEPGEKVVCQTESDKNIYIEGTVLKSYKKEINGQNRTFVQIKQADGKIRDVLGMDLMNKYEFNALNSHLDKNNKFVLITAKDIEEFINKPSGNVSKDTEPQNKEPNIVITSHPVVSVEAENGTKPTVDTEIESKVTSEATVEEVVATTNDITTKYGNAVKVGEWYYDTESGLDGTVVSTDDKIVELCLNPGTMKVTGNNLVSLSEILENNIDFTKAENFNEIEKMVKDATEPHLYTTDEHIIDSEVPFIPENNTVITNKSDIYISPNRKEIEVGDTVFMSKGKEFVEVSITNKDAKGRFTVEPVFGGKKLTAGPEVLYGKEEIDSLSNKKRENLLSKASESFKEAYNNESLSQDKSFNYGFDEVEEIDETVVVIEDLDTQIASCDNDTQNDVTAKGSISKTLDEAVEL